MVELVKIHISSRRNSCKCYNTTVMVVGRSLEKVGGFTLRHGQFVIDR